MIQIFREGKEIMIKVGENQVHFTDFVKIRYRKKYCDVLFHNDPTEDFFRSFIREDPGDIKTDRNGLSIEQSVDEFGNVFEEIRPEAGE